jgi:hypothetical protein
MEHGVRSLVRTDQKANRNETQENKMKIVSGSGVYGTVIYGFDGVMELIEGRTARMPDHEKIHREREQAKRADNGKKYV